MKPNMTYDEFDAMWQRFEDSNTNNDEWFPTLHEIKTHIESNIKTMLEFAIWLDATSREPITEEEQTARRYLRDVIKRNLKLREGDSPVK